jgi:sugar fermentation stimulation protein A
MAFVIQMPKIREVRPNLVTHPAFGDAWQEALEAGVKIWFMGCDVKADALSIDYSRVCAEK